MFEKKEVKQEAASVAPLAIPAGPDRAALQNDRGFSDPGFRQSELERLGRANSKGSTLFTGDLADRAATVLPGMAAYQPQALHPNAEGKAAENRPLGDLADRAATVLPGTAAYQPQALHPNAEGKTAENRPLGDLADRAATVLPGKAAYQPQALHTNATR